jgi:hypothetical protein
VLAGGLAVARWRQGVAGDLKGATGKVPGKEERAVTHRNDRFAPVVIDVRGGVLQHRCGRGKRDLAPIRRMAKFGGRSPERGDGDDARTEFGAEVRLRQRKASEADAGSVRKRVRRSVVDR